ncbi:MAG: 2-enoyl thioester reductase domain-containing protein [Chthoniobacteraceae bacterium]
MKKASALMFHELGNPAEVLRLEEIEVRAPQPGGVLIEMLASPINPANLNVIEGTYARLPTLPAIAGGEAAGVVAAVGEGVTEIEPGQVVILPFGEGTWCTYCVRQASDLVVVPDGISAEQASMLRVNPPTAWHMLHDYVKLAPGEWILQNAANSGVGRAVIDIAHALGLRTVNVVRRPELIEELKAAGADVVLLDTRDLAKETAAATGGAKIRLALNAVSGDSAIHLAKTVAEGATIVTYGAMSKQALKIPNGLLIFKDLVWRGCWITRWYETASRTEMLEMYSHLFPLAQKGLLHAPVEKTYALTDFAAAITRAQSGERAGKIIFTRF